MTTIKQIHKELGRKKFNQMELNAELKLSTHPEFWERVNKYHDIICADIINQYDKLPKPKRKERIYYQI